MSNINEKDLNVLDKFTEHLKKSLLAAQNLAASLNQTDITPIHLLYGLTALKGSISREILNKAGLEQLKFQRFIVENERPDLLNSKVWPTGENSESRVNELILPNLGPDARKVIERAVIIAADFKHRYIGSEHLLLSLLNNLSLNLLTRIGLNEEKINGLKDQLVIILKSSTKFSELADNGTEAGNSDETTGEKKMSTLQLLATELTDPQIQEGIDPVIGRDKEIDRLINILARRRKNNPVLLGDPGVGKTAIVEGLAKKILANDVPASLRNKRIFSLDLGLLIAGTSFRGEFEQRLKQVLEEVKSQSDIILFIDEIHSIVGAGGSGNGNMDMANLLKPGLARGEIRCIGATTLDEYRKTIENDSALERRFQPIIVDEPTTEQTVAILTGLKRNYEVFHRVSIDQKAVEMAVEWSRKYIHDRFLPDKAIDLIDEASAAVKVKAKATKDESDEYELQAELQSILRQKHDSVLNEKYEAAMNLWQKEQKIRARLAEVKKKLSSEKLPPLGQITEADIAKVVERLTRIPATQLLQEGKQQIKNFEPLLRAVIVGQDEAITKISQAIRLSQLGINPEKRPIGSFLFLGPSGVGKTEMAKQIARLMFGDPKALIRIDMSEYGESFNVSKLIGAPAGYVGYKESGKLTEAIRRRPYSVVLFDEVEKAHPDIFNLFLQVLDEGHLTDATGKMVNFEHSIIIFTSNIGLDILNQQSAMGFALDENNNEEKDKFKRHSEETKRRVTKELDNFFRLEFLNRLDHVIVFESLSKKDLQTISEQQISNLEQRLSQYRLKLLLSPQASAYIVDKSFSPEKGARAVKQYLKDEVENRIAEMLVNNKIKPGQKINIGIVKNKLSLKVTK